MTSSPKLWLHSPLTSFDVTNIASNGGRASNFQVTASRLLLQGKDHTFLFGNNSLVQQSVDLKTGFAHR
jgi:hypothetical protein